MTDRSTPCCSRSMATELRSFSPSLPQQKSDLFRPVQILKGTFEGGGAKGGASLSVATPTGPEQVPIWLTFAIGTTSLFVPFEGEYSCHGDDCKLVGAALENVPLWSETPYLRKGDTLMLTGNNKGQMDGSLRPATREVFSEGRRTRKCSTACILMKNNSSYLTPNVLGARQQRPDFCLPALARSERSLFAVAPRAKV
jgi:hypothetical protein